MAFGEKRGGIRQEVPDRKVLSRHCNLARMALLLPIVFTMIQVITRYLFQTGDYLFTLFFPNILLSWDCAALLESLGLTVSNGATVQIAAQILGAALLVLFIFPPRDIIFAFQAIVAGMGPVEFPFKILFPGDLPGV